VNVRVPCLGPWCGTLPALTVLSLMCCTHPSTALPLASSHAGAWLNFTVVAMVARLGIAETNCSRTNKWSARSRGPIRSCARSRNKTFLVELPGWSSCVEQSKVV
jgi:hypothetical protein